MEDSTDTPKYEYGVEVLREEGCSIGRHRQRDADSRHPGHGGRKTLSRPFGDVAAKERPNGC